MKRISRTTGLTDAVSHDKKGSRAVNDKEFDRWNASGNLGGDGAMNGEGSDRPVSDRHATPGTIGGAYGQSSNPGSGTPASLGNTASSAGHPGSQTPHADRGAFDTQRFAPRPEGSLPSSATSTGPHGASSAQQAPGGSNQAEIANTIGLRPTYSGRPTPGAGSAPMAHSAPAPGGAPYASFGSHPNDRYRGYGGNHAPQQLPARRKGSRALRPWRSSQDSWAVPVEQGLSTGSQNPIRMLPSRAKPRLRSGRWRRMGE